MGKMVTFWKAVFRWLGLLVLAAVSLMITFGMLALTLVGFDDAQAPAQYRYHMRDSFEMYLNNVTADALDDILETKKIYWLHDSDAVAPEPDPACYGQTDDPAELESVLREAETLLDGQELVFRTDTQLMKGSWIKYYLDETILVITWKHTVGNVVYTCSEVKIAHPSQFRRFLSDGKFGSGKLYLASEMAASVNAVTASNGDYYGYRNYGNIVYNGEVKRWGNQYLDTCYIDEKGDLIMLDYGKVVSKEQMEAFVAENNIRFSLAFGPVLLRDGKRCEKFYYAVGETDGTYSRAALCQQGPLHYVLVAANRRGQTISQFSRHLQELGIRNAYALDGGQTCAIITGDELMNKVDYGGERKTSDIIYFATALPYGG